MARKSPKQKVRKVTIIRSDRWRLNATPEQLAILEETIQMYRGFVRALMGVIFVHWPEIARAASRCAAVEKLIHETANNPSPRYAYFRKCYHKFPSYLRRAAIEAALGQVSSFVTRYSRWQSGIRSRRDALPPAFNADTNLNPPLYIGQCYKFGLTKKAAPAV